MGKGGKLSCDLEKKRNVYTKAMKEERRFRVACFVIAGSLFHQHTAAAHEVRPNQDKTKVGETFVWFHQTVLFLSFVSVDFGLPVCWTRFPSSDTVRTAWSLIRGVGVVRAAV